MGTNKLELTTAELLERGWTRTLIKRFLPKPDGNVPVNHWANFRGQDTYSAIKVWNVEQSDAFEAAFLRSWKNRKSARIAATSPQAFLAKMRRKPHPKIPRRTKEQIQDDMIILKAAALIEEMRAKGYRTPHR
jgi:hypothetical protein